MFNLEAMTTKEIEQLRRIAWAAEGYYCRLEKGDAANSMHELWLDIIFELRRRREENIK